MPAVPCGSDGEVYILAGGEGRWELTKPDGTKHVVECGPRGWHCDCNDWKYRGRKRPCKHVLAVAGQQAG